MARFDRHFKCPKELKVAFALQNSARWFKKAMMSATQTYNTTEYAVEPRGPKSVPERASGPQRKRAA